MQVIKDLHIKRKIRNFLISDDEMSLIKENAEKYANGNISAWIRYASMNYVPKKSELVKVEKQKKD